MKSILKSILESKRGEQIKANAGCESKAQSARTENGECKGTMLLPAKEVLCLLKNKATTEGEFGRTDFGSEEAGLSADSVQTRAP